MYGLQWTKSFSFSVYGSEEAAKEAAEEWREERLEEIAELDNNRIVVASEIIRKEYEREQKRKEYRIVNAAKIAQQDYEEDQLQRQKEANSYFERVRLAGINKEGHGWAPDCIQDWIAANPERSKSPDVIDLLRFLRSLYSNLPGVRSVDDVEMQVKSKEDSRGAPPLTMKDLFDVNGNPTVPDAIIARKSSSVPVYTPKNKLWAGPKDVEV